MKFVIFSNNQGSGYISNEEIDNFITKTPITINNEIINTGEMTDLSNHFSTPLKYIGVNKNKKNEMIFFIDYSTDLFVTQYYYLSVFKIAENRIFEIYGQGSGRDFLFINGKWK